MRSLGCSSEATGYVGDSPEDIEMGSAPGFLPVGVRQRLSNQLEIEKSHEPDILIESLPQLLNHF